MRPCLLKYWKQKILCLLGLPCLPGPTLPSWRTLLAWPTLLSWCTLLAWPTVKKVNLPFSFNSLLSKVKNFDSTKTDLSRRKEKV